MISGRVTVGHGAVVGAGATVSRLRFAKPVVKRLCALRPWNLDDADVVGLLDLLNDRLEAAVDERRPRRLAAR